MAKLKQISKKI